MPNEVEARTDAVFNKWDSLPTEEAKRNALADALVEVEQIPCTAGLLDALEKAADRRKQMAKITRSR